MLEPRYFPSILEFRIRLNRQQAIEIFEQDS